MKEYFNRIITDIKLVLIEPRNFWLEHQKAGVGSRNPFSGFFLPLLIVVFLAVFTGEAIRGSKFYLTFPLMKAGREVLLFLLQFVISVFLTNTLINSFGGEKNIVVSRKLVAYSLAPILLVSAITGLFPSLYVINVLGLYGFYIFWIGVVVMLEFPERKQSSYILLAITTNFFVFGFLSIFLSRLLSAFL